MACPITLRGRIAALLVVTAAVTVQSVLAQEEFAGVYGTVTDADGQNLPGVTVNLQGPGAQKLQVSDDLGKFRFLRLEPGVWSLHANLDGFSTVEYPEIHIRAGHDSSVIIQLTAQVEEVITITAESPLMDERKISTGTSLTELELDTSPTAQDPWAVVNQAPGVMVERIDIGGSHSQQSGFVAPAMAHSDNDWIIDGAQIMDMAHTGSPPTYFDFDQFSQIDVATGGNDVTKTTAGVAVNLVTKRGTNEMRGSARFLVTDQDLFLFFKQSSPNVDPDEFPPDQMLVEPSQVDWIQNYGFEAGGPAVRDKLWLWGSFGVNVVKETLVGGFNQDTSVESAAFKVSSQISRANSAVASWNNGDKQIPIRGAGPDRTLESAVRQRGPTAIFKVEDSHVFSSSLFLTGMWSKVDGGVSLTSIGCILAGGCDLATEYLLDADGINRNSYWSLVASQPSTEWKIDGSQFVNAGQTSHEIKFGGRWREFESSSQFGWPGGRNIGNYAGTLWGFPPGGRDVFFAQRGDGPLVLQEYGSLWIQDTLTFGKWTLNAGLRYDHQDGENPPINVPANPGVPEFLPGLEFSGNDGGFNWATISPRLGATYALGSERQTLIRASYSRFASLLDRSDIARVNPVSAAYAYFSFSDLDGDQLWQGPGEPFELFRTVGYDRLDPTALESPNVTDPDYSPELTDEIVLGLEHSFLPELVGGVSVTWRNRSEIRELRRFVTDRNTGVRRLARREDYVFARSIDITQPDGSPYTVDYYALAPEFIPTGGSLLLNGDREVEYVGATLSLTKRLTNRWMMRGFVNYGQGEWSIPASFFEFDDPTRADATTVIGFDQDGGVWAPGREERRDWLILQSTWSFNINGMYQIAPERPWGFNLAGNIYGREGYPRPLYTRFFGEYARASENSGDFRYADVYTVDLRFEKEFAATSNVGLTVSADLFNSFNEGYVLKRNNQMNTSQANYVLETLSPRIWRLGVRINWR